MTTATTTASVLPHSTQEGSHSASQTPPRPLAPLTLPPSDPPATMLSLCPHNTNGLGFQLILLLFKKEKERKTSAQDWWFRSLTTMQCAFKYCQRGKTNPLTGLYKPLTYVGHPPVTETTTFRTDWCETKQKKL